MFHLDTLHYMDQMMSKYYLLWSAFIMRLANMLYYVRDKAAFQDYNIAH